jgi:hypothetical protein
MKLKTTLAVCAAAVGLLFAVPQSASALPAAKDVGKQATQSNVEKAGYYGQRRGWRRGYYRRHHYGYGRRYYRRPGFGIYLGF